MATFPINIEANLQVFLTIRSNTGQVLATFQLIEPLPPVPGGSGYGPGPSDPPARESDPEAPNFYQGPR